MGVINHNVVIATTWSDEEFNRVGEWIGNLTREQRTLFVTNINQFGSFTIVMAPDGSNEGWKASDEGDKLRDEFVALLESSKYEDGSNPWRYIEVSYGEHGQSIVRGNNKRTCVHD